MLSLLEDDAGLPSQGGCGGWVGGSKVSRRWKMPGSTSRAMCVTAYCSRLGKCKSPGRLVGCIDRDKKNTESVKL